jgi:hypothetical protein
MIHPPSSELEPASPLLRKVLSITHDPIIPREGNVRLSQLLGWNDPAMLARQFISDVFDCSFGVARFEIVEAIEVHAFPVKADGFQYSPNSFLDAWRSRSGFHQPDRVDYHAILEEYDVIAKVNRREIDEVWLFAFPYAGYYESIMAGLGAFWCNAPPLSDTDDCSRRFVIMGFNYERGVGEMLEDLGHRTESVLAHVFRDQGRHHLWEQFVRYDLTSPGRAEVGNIHFAPNSDRDYDWGNPRLVPSKCDQWYRYPDLRNEFRLVNCEEWGGGDIRSHHLWWFKHLPHFEGTLDGISNNWWNYSIDPNQVR